MWFSKFGLLARSYCSTVTENSMPQHTTKMNRRTDQNGYHFDFGQITKDGKTALGGVAGGAMAVRLLPTVEPLYVSYGEAGEVSDVTRIPDLRAVGNKE